MITSKNRIVCSKHNEIWALEKAYEVDFSGKVISYEFNTATDYSKKSDDEFIAMCDDIEDFSSNLGITKSSYCDLENKKYHDGVKYSYDEIKKYKSVLEDIFEYIDDNGILKKDEWIKAMEKDGYTCN